MAAVLKELQEQDAAKLYRQRLDARATKQTKMRIRTSQSLPTECTEKRSDLSIVSEINEKIGRNISVKAASMTVRERGG